MHTQTSLHETVFTEPTEFEVQAMRVFDAPREVVWKAHTDPEYVRRWLLGPEGWTMTTCEIDLRPGGEWHYVWEGPASERLEMRGEYREVTAPRRLVNTEAWGGDWPETINTLELTEENGMTMAISTVRYPSREARENAYATGMKDGWAESNSRLDRHLDSMR